MKNWRFLFLLLLGIFMPVFSFAATDNFDSYSNGQLMNELGSWVDNASSTWQVSNEYSTSSPNSMKSGTAGTLYFTTAASSTYSVFEMDFFASSSANNFFGLTTSNNPGANLTMLYIECYPVWYGDQCALGLVYGASGIKTLRIDPQKWVHLKWTVDFVNEIQTLEYTHDGNTENATATTDSDGNKWIHNPYFSVYESDNFYTDNFQYTGYDGVPCSVWTDFANCIWEGNPVYPTGSEGTGNCRWISTGSTGFCEDVAGWSTGLDTADIFPATPADCRFSAVTYDTSTITVQATGHFFNPPVCSGDLQFCQPNNVTYTDLKINFYDIDDEVTSTVLISEIPVNTGETYNETIVLPLGNYRLDYTAETSDGVGFIHSCTAGVGPSALTGTTTIQWYGSGLDICAGIYESCIASSTSFLDEKICDLENLALLFVCPSPEVLGKAKGIVSDIKTRFPVSYITAFTNTFSSLSASGALATSTATTTMVSSDISGIAEIAAFTPFAVLRTLGVIIIILLFGFFAVKLISKEFFT